MSARARAGKGRRGPRRQRPPVQLHPAAAERAYTRSLLEMVARLTAIVKRRTPALLAALARGDSAHVDQDDPTGSIRLEFTRAVPASAASARAKAAARQVDLFNEGQVQRQARAVLGVDVLMPKGVLADLAPGFVKDNVALIKSIGEQYADQVGELVTDAFRTGRRPESLAADLEERAGVTESRARLIARDQVSKLNGALTEARQTGLGVEAYVWRTSRDERVRKAHADLEGTRFTWASGGSDTEGNPGEAVQCRCRPEPVFPDDE